MAKSRATAPGKIILFGEHAVVYGRPAIAAPVTQVRATAVVEDGEKDDILLRAPDLGRESWFSRTPKNEPFARAVDLVLESSSLPNLPNLIITVNSTIPIASGLGSGAAMAAAVIRALARHLRLTGLTSDSKVSELTYQVETILHGTPSGIDNTVVAYEKPVFFVRQEPQNRIETFSVAQPLRLLIADSGKPSMTKDVVGDVRRRWQEEPAKFNRLFDECGRIAQTARLQIESGDLNEIGKLMLENQALLREMTVSTPELESLIDVAISAGALGAKLSGAGRGGNMIALVDQRLENHVKEELLKVGARQVFSSVIT